MGSARSVGKAFFPLDKELGLGKERLTPHAYESLVRWGARMPFEQAAEELAFSLGVEVSEATARRYTEAAGGAYVDWQTAEMERLEKEMPAPVAGGEKLFFSADGAMVPLVGGLWTEVKTLTIGEIREPVYEQGEWVVHSEKLSYFSRVAEASLFCRLAWVESHRRGLELARLIAAVTDGAEWEQGLIDLHCPQANRILDLPHAGERVCEVASLVGANDPSAGKSWQDHQLHQLKHFGPDELLTEMHRLQEQYPQSEVVRVNLAYLEKREPHMQYPVYQALGLPIGSGAMESANKIVVEARLKGAGMHWALPHVNPMLALRNILCSNRWQEAWPQITAQLQQTSLSRKQALRASKQAPLPAQMPQVPAPLAPVDLPSLDTPLSTLPASPPPQQPTNGPAPLKWRPAPNHPWRNSPIGSARFRPHISKN